MNSTWLSLLMSVGPFFSGRGGGRGEVSICTAAGQLVYNLNRILVNLNSAEICLNSAKVSLNSAKVSLNSAKVSLNSALISLLNLENICYFPSCSGGTISLHHSITPSLLHFLLDIWKPGGVPPYEKARNVCRKI